MPLSLTRAIAISLPLLGFQAPANATGMPPEQVKPILEMTKANWIAYRDFNGQQLIYFTHLESWKCGINAVHYGLNGEAPETEWVLEVCDANNPNQVTKDKPHLTFPLNHVKSVTVRLTFKDGSISAPETFLAP